MSFRIFEKIVIMSFTVQTELKLWENDDDKFVFT